MLEECNDRRAHIRAFKTEIKDGFIPVVACDEHAKEKDFYRYIEKKKTQQNSYIDLLTKLEWMV